MVTAKHLDEDILYPSSDGEPMSDNTEQYRWIVTIKENLEILFAAAENVFIAADLLWYPVPSKEVKATAPKSKSIGPDVMVVFGRPKGKRKSYLQWKEDNIPPQVVFEILSESNTEEDMQQKLEFYQEYGVEEYYIYDLETYVLEGLMRRGNQLVPLEQVNGWVSPRLGIKFEVAGGELGIYHPNGKRFLTPLELNAESEQRIQAERQRADLERQRADLERQRAEKFAEYLRSLGLDPDHLPESN